MSETNIKVSDWYKVPFREVYCQTRRDWFVITMYYHTFARLKTGLAIVRKTR